MKKAELIKVYGNDFKAYDTETYYKPLVLCYWDEDRVLAYDVERDSYHAVKLNSTMSGNYYFIIDGKIYKLDSFVRTGTAWTGNEQTLNEWKEQYS